MLHATTILKFLYKSQVKADCMTDKVTLCVMVTIIGKWTQRNEFKSWMMPSAFHIALIPLGKVCIQLFSLQIWVNSRAD